ncbi:lysine-2,3-aminomutase-like protein [Granulosicoccus antarcticus]|uniref:L-lysine 2,3-aminomutase n=1 Tax=Granulosicoccus antarcticus IMCC3135 TaxID=1192854 RepID=A0A2Z2NJ22_9GAMM|nr:lysine-2,3-aminomutase-like protein [Granulosicoccus antarcticus]ASJ71073.1 L-lysine 2,3-aminomutase [Granulosicoccus antarcticus IMCC3135]
MSKQSVRDVKGLLAHNVIAHEQSDQISQVIKKFSVGITPQVMDTIANADNPGVFNQFVPSVAELLETPGESSDPIGDQAHSPVPGIIHRYEDRVLLNVVQTCAVYCRYCFRRENVGSGNAGLTPPQIDNALDYIRSDKKLWEVIFSGGDPLTLSPRRLADIIRQISDMEHIGIIRFHTRVPSVAPDKINDDLLKALKLHPATYLILHINHPDELTPQVCEKLALLADAGIPLLSQSVLLRNVNDNVDVLTRLFRKLLVNRVKPYYLHHGDLARGTSHFRTSIEQGQNLMRELRGPLSGLCQPNYMLDLPGGAGKVPIGPQYLSSCGENRYTVNDVSGKNHAYMDECPALDQGQ